MERIDLQEMLFPPSVAVVEISGQIGSRLNPREVSRMLDGLRGNARFPAVVLDIDSPGGGAAASESIYLAAQRLAARKPVAAAIRGVGASGGYMVACAANPIFALPTSIVGSIGVIMVLPMVAEALERLGVKMRTHTSGEYKDIGSLFRDTTPEEEAKLRAIIDSIYERFIEIVDQGRPDLARDEIAKLASGEMHTGARARELGLIDQLGDLDDAVAWAAKAAGIPKRTQVLRPRRPLLQMMMQRSADGMAEALVDAVLARLSAEPAERLLQARLGR